jgi:hypothetical protein
MPDTKNRGTPKRTGSSKTKPKSSRSKSKSKSTEAKSSGNGVAAVDSVRHTVEDKAKTAGQTMGKAASKAKVPLIAGGAALAGAAGGLALASRQDRHHRLIKSMRKPMIKLTSRDVAKAAKEVGNFSAQVGELATELQRAREQTGNGRRRSPVEVVLQGLTARR